MAPIELAALLVCPACRGALVRGDGTLACAGGCARYAVENGVPILLAPGVRAAVEAARAAWGGERVTTAGNASWLVRLRPLLPGPAPFLNRVSGRNLARIDGELRRLERRPLVLDLGSGGGDGAGLDRLGADIRSQAMVCVDIDAFPGVDVVASGDRLPLAAASFDVVLLKAVLEHVPDAPAVLAEAWRVLRPGGLVYVEVPFLFEYHPNPGDFVRFTRAGLERALEAFAAVEVGTLVGPFAALASLAAHDAALLLSLRSRLLRKGLLPFLTWIFWPLSLLDFVVLGHPGAHFVAHHLYGFGRKPGSIS